MRPDESPWYGDSYDPDIHGDDEPPNPNPWRHAAWAIAAVLAALLFWRYIL
jgi:hypothetical protein